MIRQKFVTSAGSRAPAGPGMTMVTPADMHAPTPTNNPPTWNSGSEIIARSPFR